MFGLVFFQISLNDFGIDASLSRHEARVDTVMPFDDLGVEVFNVRHIIPFGKETGSSSRDEELRRKVHPMRKNGYLMEAEFSYRSR
jgi:hypothetical protein